MTDYAHQHTSPKFTNTTDGPIAHLRVIVAGLILDAPVMLVTRLKGAGIFQRPRVNADGRYLHAMPGGQVVVGKFVK